MNILQAAIPQIIKKAKKQCIKKSGTENVFSLLLIFDLLENKNKAILISDKKEINTDIEATDIKDFILTQVKKKLPKEIKSIDKINIIFNFIENNIKYSIFFILESGQKNFIESEL